VTDTEAADDSLETVDTEPETPAADDELAADDEPATEDESDELDETASESDDTAELTATAPNAGPEFDGSIAARLAAEIRDGTVDDDDLETIQSELDLEPAGPEIAKVEHLQTRVEEVTAYTDALETFLEENGTGAQLIEELQTDLEGLEDDLARRWTIDSPGRTRGSTNSTTISRISPTGTPISSRTSAASRTTSTNSTIPSTI